MQRVYEENKWGEVSKIIVTVRDANQVGHFPDVLVQLVLYFEGI